MLNVYWKSESMKKIIITCTLLSSLTLISGCGHIAMFGLNVLQAPGEIVAEKDIRIYGKVVDQNANPIPDAKVWITSSQFDLFALDLYPLGQGNSDYQRTTNKKGEFKFQKRCQNIRIANITCQGHKPFGYMTIDSMKTQTGQKYKQKKHDPAVFILHKIKPEHWD